MHISPLQIIAGTPAWVWAILAALLVLGVRQLRDRSVPPVSVLIAPVIFLGLGLISSSRQGAGLALWAISFVASAAVAAFVFASKRGARFDSAQHRLLIPGSIVPLALMLSMFALNYAIAVASVISRTAATSSVWQLGSSALLGVLSGQFFGRSVSLFRLSRQH